MEDGPSGKIVRALVPLSKCSVMQLRSATQGRASDSMEFGKYAETPNNIAQAVIEDRR